VGVKTIHKSEKKPRGKENTMGQNGTKKCCECDLSLSERK